MIWTVRLMCGVHETPFAKQADPAHPKGQPMRKRRARRATGPAPGIFLWGVFYAFRSLFWQGLDSLSHLPTDYARKDLIFMGFYLSKCVDGRYFNRAIPGYHNKIES